MRVDNAVPEAIIVDIFAKLPVKSLIRFMCLSKSCSQAISDPQFFTLHLHHPNQSNKQFLLQISECPLTLQSLSFCHRQLLRKSVTLPQNRLLRRWQWEMVGSCNGVLCLSNIEYKHHFGILNPSIQRFKLVPFPPLEDSFSFANCYYNRIYCSVSRTGFSIQIGFGFDSCTSDFKIVIIFQEIDSRRLRKVQVYSLGENSWKVLSNVPNVSYHLTKPKVVFNGAFYWVDDPIYGGQSLVMFDFTDETFKEIKLPDFVYRQQGCSLYKVDGMGEVKGKLSLLLHSRGYSLMGVSLEMWMVEDSVWVKQFVVNLETIFAPICLGMNDEVMLLMTDYGYRHIVSCDIKTLEMTDLGVQEERLRDFTYTSSLALLGGRKLVV